MWLCLHGFTGGPRSWDCVASHLGLGPPLVTPALLGHGQDWRERITRSFESEVGRLAALASEHAPPRFLCGYSMGARVALGLLAQHGHLFDAAALIGAHPGLARQEERAARRETDARWARMLREEGIAAFVNAWEQLPLFESQQDLSAEARASQRDIRLAHDADGLALALEVLGLAEMPAYRPSLGALVSPLILVSGERDAKFTNISRELAGESPHLEVEIVRGVGHNVVLEAPRVVASVMRQVQQRVVA